MSKAVCKTGTSPTEKAEQERKRSQSIYAPMLRVLCCVSLAGKVKLSLEVKMLENELLEDKGIYSESLSCARFQTHRLFFAGQNQSCGRRWQHKSYDFPDQ